jgi:two-component system invasion response regulator UvrY
MGATGYVGKHSPPQELLRAVSDVATGKVPENGTNPCLIPVANYLSPREHRVMLALGEGKRPTNIAAELNLSVRTISTYKRRVLNKLYLSSDAALVHYVLEHKKLNTPNGH